MAELIDWDALLEEDSRSTTAAGRDWGELLDIESLQPAIRKRVAGGIGPLKPSLTENLGLGFGIGKDLDDEAARTIVADSGIPSNNKQSVELAKRLDRLYRIARADMFEQFNDVELRARVPKSDRELYLGVLQDLGANAAPELGPVGKFSTRVARGIEGMFTGVERSAVELAGTKEAQDEYRWLATRQQIKRGALPATSENLFMRGLYAAGEMAPPMVASALTMKGLTGLVGAKTATAGQMGFWGAQEFPGLMDELRAGGASDTQAKAIALPAAGLIGAIELWERPWNALGLEEGVKASARQTAKRAALEFVKSWGKEWGEEAMQSGVSHVAKEVSAVIDPNVSLDRKAEWESAKNELLDAALALPFMMGPGHAARGLQDYRTGKKQAAQFEAWKGSPSAHAAVSLTGMSDDERRAFVESQADRWVSELDPRTAAERIAAVESLATPMKGEIDVGEYPSRKAFSQATGFPLPSGPDRQAFVDRVRQLHQQAAEAAAKQPTEPAPQPAVPPTEEQPNAEAVRSDQGPSGEPGGPVRQGPGPSGGDLQQQAPGQPGDWTPQREVPSQREAEEAALERARLIDRIAGIFDWAPKQALAGLPLEELRALEQQPMLKLETTLRGLAEQRPPEPPQEPAAEVPMPEPTGKRLKPVPAASEQPPAEPQAQQPVQQLIDRLQVLVEAGDDTARALQYYLTSPRIPAAQRESTINAAAEYLAEKERTLGQPVPSGLPVESPGVDRVGKGLGPQAKAPVVPEQPSAEQPQAAPAEAQPEARPPEPAAEQPPAVPPGRGPVVGEGIPENVPEPEMVAGVLQPWEMTQGEYVDQDKAVMAADEAMVNATGRSKSKKAEGIWRRRLMEAQSAHHAIVAAAVKKGFPVASKVLADYPDLQPSTAVQPPAEPGGKGMAKVPVEEQAPVSGQTGSTPGGPDAATVASEAQPAGAEPSPAAPPVAKPAEALPPATPAVAPAATASMGRGLRTPEGPVGERGAGQAEMSGQPSGAAQANIPEAAAPAGRGMRLKPVSPRGQTALPGLEPEAASREEEDRFADLAISAIQDVVTPEAAEQARGILRRVPSLIRKWGKIEADRMLGDLDYDEIKTMTTEELADAVDQQVWENLGDLPPVGLGELRARPIGTVSEDKAIDKAEGRRNDMILDAIAQETRRSLDPEVERIKAEAKRRRDEADSGERAAEEAQRKRDEEDERSAMAERSRMMADVGFWAGTGRMNPDYEERLMYLLDVETMAGVPAALKNADFQTVQKAHQIAMDDKAQQEQRAAATPSPTASPPSPGPAVTETPALNPLPGDLVRYRNSGGAEFEGEVTRVWGDDGKVDVLPHGGKNPVGMESRRIVAIVKRGPKGERADAAKPPAAVTTPAAKPSVSAPTEQQDEYRTVERPWSNSDPEDETRWYGTKVGVSADKRSEGFTGTVVRVLNRGQLVEVRPDGQEGTFRIPSNRTIVMDLQDSGRKVKPDVPAAVETPPQAGLPRLTDQDTIDLSGLSDQQLRHLAKRHKPNTYSQIADIGKSVQDEIRRRGIKDYTEGPAEAKPLLDAYMKARSAREDAEKAVTTAHTHRNSVEHAMIQDEARKRGVPLGGRGKHGLSAAKQYVNKVHDAKNAAQKRPELAKAQDAIRDAEHKVRDAKAAEEAADREWARAAASGMPQIPAGQKRRAIEGYGNQVVVREFDPERGQYRVEGLGGNEYYVSPQPLLDNYMSEEEASQAKAIEDAFSEAARTAESKRVAKGQAEFQQKQAEASASKKVRDKERFINTRFWNQLKNRANALGTTKQEEKIVEKDGIVKLKREIIDDTWMVRQEPKTEDGKAGGFSLVHRPTNTVASTGNTANEAKQLYLLAIQDGGIDLSKLKDGDKITPEQAKLFRSIERAWDKQDLDELVDDEQSKALKAKWLESTKAPAPGFTADMVLDGSDFVEADAAVARIKMLASEVPEFAYDPVFTVDADKKLVYRDGFKYRFEPKALNVEPFYLKPGMTVGINLEDLGIKRKTPQDVVAEALSQQGFTVSRSKAGTVKAKWKLRTITAQPDANDPTSWSILEQNPDADRAREIVNAIRWRQPGQEAPQKTLTTIPGGKVESGISGPPQEQAGYTKKERKELAQKMKMAESVRKKRKGKPLQPAPSAEAQPAAEAQPPDETGAEGEGPSDVQGMRIPGGTEAPSQKPVQQPQASPSRDDIDYMEQRGLRGAEYWQHVAREADARGIPVQSPEGDRMIELAKGVNVAKQLSRPAPAAEGADAVFVQRMMGEKAAASRPGGGVHAQVAPEGPSAAYPRPTTAPAGAEPGQAEYERRGAAVEVPPPTEDAKAKRIEAQPIPMPELIQLVKELLGDVPSVKRLRKYLGFFQGQEGGFGRMVINAIAAKDEVLLAKVLAHEAGHMVDWLPEHTLKRGNILGRIASLHGYLKHWLEGKPGGPGPLTEADRARLRREAERTMKKGAEVEIEEEIVERFSITPDDILNIWNSVEEDANKDLVNYIKRLSSAEKLSLIKEAFRGVVPEEVQKFAKEIRHKTGRKITKTVETSATPEEVHAKYLDLLREEAQKRQLLSLEKVREELIGLTEWWTPFDRRTSTKDYIAYRESSPELYAEALSVFLNSPHELAKRAPEFYRGFCGWLSNKPDVMDTFWSIQETLGGGADKVSAEREAIRRAMYLEADQKILAARQARENARLHPLAAVRSFLSQYVLHRAAPIRGRALKSSSAEAKAAFYTADELAYAENRSYRMLQRVRDDVWKPLLDVGVTQEDIGDYLFMRRVVNERNEIANPLGYVPSEAASELDQMRKKLGDEKFTALEERMKAWHDILFESVEAAVDAGVYSQENFDKIKENKDNYATFAVIKYLEDYVSPAIRQQIGTFQGIANPWDATTMKFIALNRLIELNSAKNTVRDMLRKDFSGEIRAIPVPYGKSEPSETPRPGFDFVSILEDGKVRFYEVPSEIATSFKRSDIGGLGRFAAIAQSGVYRLFHPLFVTFNPGFIAANPFRDLRRTWINLGAVGGTLHQQLMSELVAKGMSLKDAKEAAAPQKITAWQVFRAFWKARKDAKKYVTGIEDDAVNEMIAQKALSVPYVEIAAEAGEPGEAKRMMEHYGLTEPEQAETRNMASRFVGAIFEAIHREGAIQEVAGKLSAWNLLSKRMESAKNLGVDLISERERSHIVRRYAGTPDFKQKGLATPVLNSVWMYSNVKWQGLVADLELATDSKTAAGWWWRRIASDILPTTLTKIALYGGFGAATAAILGAIGNPPDDDEYDPLGLKKMTRRIGSYFLDNYDVIPIGTVHDVTGADDKAKTMFVTVPKDETGRIISKIWSNLLDVALERAGATTKAGIPRKSWTNIFGAAKDALVPNASPPLDIASAWTEYAVGINPHDAYFGSDVVPPNAWKAGGWPATRKMLAWTQDKFGIAGDAASVVTAPFLGQAFSPNEMTTLEQTLAVPAGHHRFLRLSNRGLSEAEWAEIEAVERESAQFRESLPPEVRYLTREYFRSSKLDESSLSPSRKIEMHLQNRWYYGTYLPITRKIKAGEGDPEALRAELEQSARRVIDASKASVTVGVDNAKQFPTYRESQPEYIEKHKSPATRPVRKAGEDAEHYGKRLEKWTDASEKYGTKPASSRDRGRGRSLRQPRKMR